MIRARFAPVVLILAVLLAHGGAVRNGFLYDDYHLFVENPAVLSHAWAAVWTDPAATASRAIEGRLNIRPATLSTYLLDHAVGGGRPRVYHATQIALHALVTCAVFAVANAMRIELFGSLAAALLVGLHPIQIEAVHYLSARSSVLSTLGVLASFGAYLRWRGGGRRTWRAASLVALGLAVLSKESAVVGVVWFAAYERCIAGASWREALRRVGPQVMAAGAALAPYALLSGAAERVAAVSTGTAAATGASVLGRHAWGWLTPMGVGPVFAQHWVGWEAPTAWAGLGLVAAGAVAYARRATIPRAAWGLVAGVTALLPVLALPFQTNVALFQPHRGYLAAVGFAVATVAAGEAIGRRLLAAVRSERARRLAHTAAAVLGAGVLLAAIVMDARAGRVWRDEVGFWMAAVDRYPSEAAYHQSLGVARLRAGDPSGAAEALGAAARVDPLLPRVDFNLGVVYTKLGRDEEATEAYERAIERDPSDFRALANVGGLYERSGAVDRAAAAYRAALAVDPRLSAVRERLARLETSRSMDSRTGVSSPGGP